MDRLPKVFANKINQNINNDQKIFYGNSREVISKEDDISIVKKINNIFSSPNHVYKSNVLIKTKESETEKIIVGKTNTHLITMNGELIKIIDILDIKKIY